MIRQTESEKVRYEKRNAIENITKMRRLDKQIFHEVAKSDYEKVIKRLYYSFCDYQRYPVIQIAYMWTRMRDGLKKSGQIVTDWTHWDTYIDNIGRMLSDRESVCYLLVDGGWVYEGTVDGILQILYDYPADMEDFYVFPKDFSWLIIHCDDGGCMYKVWKGEGGSYVDDI